ncbi:WhiB family transcriptional regulator [Micromonospora craterilacus]|uniref:WhiB family transcriptional regulator n=1 Tax=Micromonospora craterilacus TaxID=1655439 RepID=A0A2W2D5H9_9ACTN|nr:WhiB family transcriptional regulator [Micromonospora craterilacus]
MRPACKDVDDPERFFPSSEAEAVSIATVYCRPCPLRPGCREWALRQGDYLWGVWGGTTQAERKRLRRGGVP